MARRERERVEDGAPQRAEELLVGGVRQAVGIQHAEERVPEGRLVQAPLEPGLLVVGQPAEPVDVVKVQEPPSRASVSVYRGIEVEVYEVPRTR